MEVYKTRGERFYHLRIGSQPYVRKFQNPGSHPGYVQLFIFVQGLISHKDREIRANILSKMEQVNPYFSLQTVVEEC